MGYFSEEMEVQWMFKRDMVKGDMADMDEGSLDNPGCVGTPAAGQWAALLYWTMWLFSPKQDPRLL